jgi:hypothetical protein
MFDLFEKAQDIPRVTLSARQQATLTRLEGFRFLRKRNFAQARTCFWDAFIQFSEVGGEKQVHCLQFCALAALCCHETVTVFASPEANHLISHPVTAPVAQLTDAYLEPNIVLFTQRLDSARKSFGNDPFYDRLLDEVRIFVLERSLKTFCLMFSIVKFEFAAGELASNETEVRNIAEELILRGELNGLLDEERTEVHMCQPRAKSVFVQNVRCLVDGMEKLLGGLLKNSWP